MITSHRISQHSTIPVSGFYAKSCAYSLMGIDVHFGALGCSAGWRQCVYSASRDAGGHGRLWRRQTPQGTLSTQAEWPSRGPTRGLRNIASVYGTSVYEQVFESRAALAKSAAWIKCTSHDFALFDFSHSHISEVLSHRRYGMFLHALFLCLGPYINA